MQHRLEERRAPSRSAKTISAIRGAVDLAVLAEDPVAEALASGAPDLRVGREQLVDDLVARDESAAPCARERAQRLALAGADAAGDRDRKRPAGTTRLVGLGRRLGRRPRGSASGSSTARLDRRRLSTGGLGLGLGLGAASTPRRRLDLGGSASPRLGLGSTQPSSDELDPRRSRRRPRLRARPLGARLRLPRPSSTRFSESERRRRSASISRISTLTGSPCETTSRGFSTWCCASSEMCTRPSTPGRISTKAPKVTTFVTRPSTTSPSP